MERMTIKSKHQEIITQVQALIYDLNGTLIREVGGLQSFPPESLTAYAEVIKAYSQLIEKDL